jgi:hypothetical protein
VILISFAMMAASLTAACDTLDSFEFWDAKKKLAGERKPVFPEGVPGVSQGIPPELVRGYQEPSPQAEANAFPQGGEPATTGTTGAEKKAEPKPKPKPVARKKPPSPPSDQAAAPASSSPPADNAVKPWPSSQPQPQPQAAWPAAPSTGRFER